MSEHDIVLHVNGETFEVTVHSQATLLEVLRERLGLTGTKEGCGMGACGACTVIIDNDAVPACLTLAVAAHGKTIRTVEGLSAEGELSPLQQAFVDHGAVQCGFCTPGMLMSATASLEQNPLLDKKGIEKALSGNLCRCTGYVKITEAVSAVSRASTAPRKNSS